MIYYISPAGLIHIIQSKKVGAIAKVTEISILKQAGLI